MNLRNLSIALAAVFCLSTSEIVLADEMMGSCDTAGSPEKIEGKGVKVDTAQGKITVRGEDGTIHEFRASQETLKDYKVGDPIKAKLRCEK